MLGFLSPDPTSASPRIAGHTGHRLYSLPYAARAAGEGAPPASGITGSVNSRASEKGEAPASSSCHKHLWSTGRMHHTRHHVRVHCRTGRGRSPPGAHRPPRTPERTPPQWTVGLGAPGYHAGSAGHTPSCGSPGHLRCSWDPDSQVSSSGNGTAPWGHTSVVHLAHVQSPLCPQRVVLSRVGWWGPSSPAPVHPGEGAAGAGVSRGPGRAQRFWGQGSFINCSMKTPFPNHTVRAGCKSLASLFG